MTQTAAKPPAPERRPRSQAAPGKSRCPKHVPEAPASPAAGQPRCLCSRGASSSRVCSAGRCSVGKTKRDADAAETAPSIQAFWGAFLFLDKLFEHRKRLSRLIVVQNTPSGRDCFCGLCFLSVCCWTQRRCFTNLESGRNFAHHPSSATDSTMLALFLTCCG